MMEQRITARKNPLIQQVRKLLTSRKERQQAGLFVADGTKLLEEAVRWYEGLDTVILSDGVQVSLPSQVRVIRIPEELMAYICKKIGVNPAEICDEEPMVVSADGIFSIEPVECLANCGFGPNVMVNDTLYSQVTRKKVDEIVSACKKQVAAEKKNK